MALVLNAVNRAARASFLLITVCVVLAGCGRTNSLVVWRKDVVSSDGLWIARAETVQNGGFGSAAIDTSVYLIQRGTHSKLHHVLGFSCPGPVPHPYVLDESANKGGTIDLRMQWVSPSHLLVTYTGNPSVYLEAGKYSGVTVTTEHRG